MKTKSLQLSIFLQTLGCAKNLVDSEYLLGKFHSAGFSIITEENDPVADVGLINTCGFIGDAKEESVDAILRFVEAKRKGRFRKVIVMGCLSQRYKEELRKELPEVDGFFGVHEQNEILRFLCPDLKKELTGERFLTTPGHYAYLKISEGCDRKCSFCAIPLIRGKQVSVPMGQIIGEAASLVALGVKEINVIAQDTTTYGTDLYGRKKLAVLLEKLTEVKGLEWIRLHYAYPTRFPMQVLQVMRENGNICRYLDIPLQHIHSAILRSMKRGTDREGTLHLLDNIRENVPGISLRTTLIVGYPGETDKAFGELYGFVREQRFNRLGVFAYSPEEDTAAFSLGNPVPEKVKEERLAAIMELQMNISKELNQEKVGSVLKVIIDREEQVCYIGRTEFDSPEVDNEVIIEKGKKKLDIGSFYPVRITSADYYDLRGVLAVSADSGRLL